MTKEGAQDPFPLYSAGASLTPACSALPRLAGFNSFSMDGSLHRDLFITLSAQNTWNMTPQGVKCCSCLPQEYQVLFFMGS